MFVVKGARNFDTLEHIVRDIVGIYGKTHGKHITEFEEYCYCLYNRVYQGEGNPADGWMPGFREANFYFSKPNPEVIKYAPFREELVTEMIRLGEALEDLSVTLWQRKLGLGVGVEFVLRLLCESDEEIDRVVDWLVHDCSSSMVGDLLVSNGALVVKEAVFSTSAEENEHNSIDIKEK